MSQPSPLELFTSTLIDLSLERGFSVSNTRHIGTNHKNSPPRVDIVAATKDGMVFSSITGELNSKWVCSSIIKALKVAVPDGTSIPMRFNRYSFEIVCGDMSVEFERYRVDLARPQFGLFTPTASVACPYQVPYTGMPSNTYGRFIFIDGDIAFEKKTDCVRYTLSS